MKLINRFTAHYSMLFLMLSYLVILLANAVLLCALKVFPYPPLDIILTALILIVVALSANTIFAKLMKADASLMSAAITALILCLIVGPLPPFENLPLLVFIAILAMGSKYLLAWRGKHLFNPAALSVFVAALLLGSGASWWAGSLWLLPVTVLGGAVIIHKIGRWHLIVSFLLTYISLFVIVTILQGQSFANVPLLLNALILHGPLLFFVFVMLVEPLTSPSRRGPRIAFGIFTGVTLVALQNIPAVGYSMELALLVGNLFAYGVGVGKRYRFTLHSVTQLADGTLGFWLTKPAGYHYLPGQYMEWSLPHRRADSRGIRRWFTVASSPTEDNVLVALRLIDPPSSFKRALCQMQPEQNIGATGPEGDFIMPRDASKPMIWIAGGIGITPFRSMAKYLIDKGEHRPVHLFYSNRTASAICFADVLNQAATVGVATTYTVSEVPAEGWTGETGQIDMAMIERQEPNFRNCIFYISGPEAMVRAIATAARRAGVPAHNIKRDYFPGY